MSALAIASLRMDGGTQSRASLNEEVIAEYADAIKGGAKFPEPVVFHDGAEYWLVDGFHRVNAFIRCERKRIDCEVKQGSLRDAILYSVSANSDHGLRRTNADKRRAVEMLLRDDEWSNKSDRWIAETVGVDHKTVSRHREELSTGEIPQLGKREGRDGKRRPSTKPKRVTPSPSEEEHAASVANDCADGLDFEEAPSAVVQKAQAVDSPEDEDDDTPQPEAEAAKLYRLAVQLMAPFSGRDLRPFDTVVFQLAGRIQKELKKVSNA